MLKKILIIVSLLMASAIISTWVGYNYSIDVRWLWPVWILFYLIFYSVYATIFMLIDRIFLASKKYIILWHIILSGILTILGILFYTVKIDWESINNGVKELTTWQYMIQSDLTLYFILLASLCLHLATRLFIRKK